MRRTLTELPAPVLVAALLTLSACSDSAGPADNGESRPASVQVSITTTGESIDRDGYVVRLGNQTLDADVNAAVRFDDIMPGAHTVELDDVAANCAVTGEPVLTVTVVEGATAQVAFTVECAFDLAGVALAEVACPALAPSAARGLPLAEIAIGAVPAALERPLLARVSTPDGSDATLGFVDEDTSAGTTLVVPLHAAGDAAGGEVLVRISDDERTCPPFVFHIDALPAAPGEFTGIVDLMQEAVAAQAAVAGTSVAALLQAVPAELPSVLLPLAVAQSVIDHPQNPNSMRAIADGAAPAMAGVDTDMLDALMARTGLRNGLLGSIDAARQRATARPMAAAAETAAAMAAEMDAVDCVTEPIELPAQLDTCMRLAADAAFRMDGVSDKVLKDIGFAIGLAGLAPNAGIKAAAAAAGLTVWGFQKVREGTAQLLPSEFVSISVEAAPDEFEEDRDGPGDWLAEVTATSRGWAMDQLVLETLFQVVGAVSAVDGAYTAYLDRVMELIPHALIDDIRGLILNQFVEAAINTTAGSGFVSIEPQVFGPVDVSDEEWSERTIVSGTSIALTAHTEYEPREYGVTLLQVRTRGGRFGGRQIGLEEPQPIEVKQIDLDFTRGIETVTELYVRPGMTYPLSLDVENSHHPDQVELDPIDPTRGHATLESVGDDSYEVRYTAPMDLLALPFLLVARHTAETGARRYSSEPRVAQVTIRPMRITITPQAGCIEPGGSLSFTAVVEGVTDQTVLWSASAGSITAAGSFTAPTDVNPGTVVTIAAVSVEDDQLRGEVAIRIGGCTCSFEMTMSGGASGWSDGPGQFRIGEDGSLEIHLPHVSGSSGDDIFAGAATAPDWAGTPGTYSVVVGTWGHLGANLGGTYRPEWGDAFTCATCGGSILVETVSEEYLTGSLDVVYPTGLPSEGFTPTHVRATFRAAFHTAFDPFSPYSKCAVHWDF